MGEVVELNPRPLGWSCLCGCETFFLLADENDQPGMVVCAGCQTAAGNLAVIVIPDWLKR